MGSCDCGICSSGIGIGSGDSGLINVISVNFENNEYIIYNIG